MKKSNIKQLFRNVYTGKVSPVNLSGDYYASESAALVKSLKKGWGISRITAKTPYVDKLTDLADNAHMFTAAKEYQLTTALRNSKIGTKTYKEYEAKAQSVYDRFDTWGEAERSTMQAQGQMARQWQDIERDKELFPMLRYSAIGDACPICAPFDGLVAPVGDKVWAKITPVNHYQCFCLLLQETSDVKASNAGRWNEAMKNADERMDAVFINNAGMTGEAFTKDHPYFVEVPKRDRKLAERNFDLPIPKSYK